MLRSLRPLCRGAAFSRSTRSFSITPKCAAAAAADPPPDTDAEESGEKKEKTPRDKAEEAADAWLATEGARFENATTFTGGSRPFPMNPYYVPQKPINNATKLEIYELFKEDPKTWTPHKLAEHFGLSMIRIQAILRLKSLAEKMTKEGKPLQTELTKNMEMMVQAYKRGTLPYFLKHSKHNASPDRINEWRHERLRFTRTEKLQPFFRIIDEEDTFTPEDAAALLRLEPYANVNRTLDVSSSRIYKLEGPTAEETAKELETIKVYDVDPVQKSKYTFMFADVGSVERTKVTIRDRDGKLRNSTKEERIRRREKPALTL
ncbi:hypothetical protein HK104_006842 [Borealophlyctis nickersoniae]|nr:hypothetical protein HK104_006842 [Borealophlyctis nickersoniae]